MGWAISHIWHLVTQDIENTLHSVGSAIVDDKSVDEVVRHRRAEALYEISKIFGVGGVHVFQRLCHTLFLPREAKARAFAMQKFCAVFMLESRVSVLHLRSLSKECVSPASKECPKHVIAKLWFSPLASVCVYGRILGGIPLGVYRKSTAAVHLGASRMLAQAKQNDRYFVFTHVLSVCCLQNTERKYEEVIEESKHSKKSSGTTGTGAGGSLAAGGDFDAKQAGGQAGEAAGQAFGQVQYLLQGHL